MWKPQLFVVCVLSIMCLSVIELRRASHALAASPSSSGEVIARCDDRHLGLAPMGNPDDPCTSRWSEQLQEQDRAPDEIEEWQSFDWGPYEMSEFELSMLYRPGERRPLWGY